MCLMETQMAGGKINSKIYIFLLKKHLLQLPTQ